MSRLHVVLLLGVLAGQKRNVFVSKGVFYMESYHKLQKAVLVKEKSLEIYAHTLQDITLQSFFFTPAHPVMRHLSD